MEINSACTSNAKAFAEHRKKEDFILTHLNSQRGLLKKVCKVDDDVNGNSSSFLFVDMLML